MEERGKGTVTPLSSLIPAEEAQKAAQRVKDNINEKQKELGKLNHFVDDNTNLINLVNHLPDELHHPIMVPFGKAAFFPGRLVHTNEFMVLLGEGYFAERSAKQTVDILNRRGNMLDSQVDSLKAAIEDLKTEATFFDMTAADAAEGLVEIREYTEDDNDKDSQESTSFSVLGEKKPDPSSAPVVDSATGAMDSEEYARMMARFDELEKEELESEDIEQQHEDDEDLKTVEDHLSLQPVPKDKSPDDKALPQTFMSKSAGQDNLRSILKTTVQPASKSKPEVGVSMANQDTGRPATDGPKVTFLESSPQNNTRTKSKTASQQVGKSTANREAGNRMSRPITDSLKAFTGSIIEREVNLPTNHNQETSQPSKPVSRFKMRRAGQI